MSDKIKTGVVGVGGLGQHHLRWLTQIPNSECVGFYDSDLNRCAEMASKHGVPALGSLEELIEKAEMLSVVVPTTFHYEVAAKAIAAGVHCLIEKPVTVTVDEALKLAKLADEHNVKVAVGQIERFNPAVRAVMERGVRPAFIEAHRLAAFNPRGTDVAVVLDLMIHDIDLCLMLTGSRPIDIHASSVGVISKQADIANARLTFENGAVANLTASRISLGAMRKIRIFEKSGYFSLDLAKRQADLYSLDSAGKETSGMRIPLGESGENLVYQKVNDDGQDMLGLELKTFLNAIADNRPVAVSLSDGTEALRVALEVERIGRESLEKMLVG
jgi:predicted dehydrogenase